MKILAFDSSFDPCGLALADEGGIVASLSFRHGRDLSKWWAPRLNWMMGEIGWKMDDLEGFAVCYGPGSFTGLRIGVAATKTLAQALSRPIVGISSLDLIALPYRSSWLGTLVSVLYCRRGEVYRAAYAEDGTALHDPSVATVEELNRELRELPAPVLVCGDAGPVGMIELPPGARQSDPWLHQPHAEVLALEGRRRLAAGEGVDPLTLTVHYLKRSQAEEQAEAMRRAKAEQTLGS